MEEHGRLVRIDLQYQRLRDTSAGRRGRGERVVGRRRGIHDDHGSTRAVQLRRTLFRQRTAVAGQEIFAAVQDLRDRAGRQYAAGAG